MKYERLSSILSVKHKEGSVYHIGQYLMVYIGMSFSIDALVKQLLSADYSFFCDEDSMNSYIKQIANSCFVFKKIDKNLDYFNYKKVLKDISSKDLTNDIFLFTSNSDLRCVDTKLFIEDYLTERDKKIILKGKLSGVELLS